MSENQTSKAVEELFQREQPSLMVLSAFQEKYKKMEEALNKIASWEEGEEVTGSFDEPGSARIARESLAFDPLK